MPHSVTQLDLNKKYDRYNYRLTQNLRYKERAKAVLDYLNKQLCMPFKNGMGYSLTVEGSSLVLVTNRCACECGELKCLTREMKGDEFIGDYQVEHRPLSAKDCENGYEIYAYNDADDKLDIEIVEHKVPADFFK